MFTVSENTEIIESIWLGVGNSILYTVSNRFYDESLEDKGLANWKAFLAENPMKVMTYLDTPIASPRKRSPPTRPFGRTARLRL